MTRQINFMTTGLLFGTPISSDKMSTLKKKNVLARGFFPFKVDLFSVENESILTVLSAYRVLMVFQNPIE